MKQPRSVACAWIGAAVIILSAIACSRKSDSGADASGQDPTAAVNSALSQVEDKAKAAMKDLDPKLQSEVDRLRQATEKLAADAAKAKESLTSKTQSALDEARQLISANRSND